MNVLWVKDNNIGHEKQVDVLLKELSKKISLNIDSRIVKNSFPFQKKIYDVKRNYYDILIGAGHKTHSILLKNKKNQKKTTKVIAILSPSFNKSKSSLFAVRICTGNCCSALQMAEPTMPLWPATKIVLFCKSNLAIF